MEGARGRGREKKRKKKKKEKERAPKKKGAFSLPLLLLLLLLLSFRLHLRQRTLERWSGRGRPLPGKSGGGTPKKKNSLLRRPRQRPRARGSRLLLRLHRASPTPRGDPSPLSRATPSLYQEYTTLRKTNRIAPRTPGSTRRASASAGGSRPGRSPSSSRLWRSRACPRRRSRWGSLRGG